MLSLFMKNTMISHGRAMVQKSTVIESSRATFGRKLFKMVENRLLESLTFSFLWNFNVLNSLRSMEGILYSDKFLGKIVLVLTHYQSLTQYQMKHTKEKVILFKYRDVTSSTTEGKHRPQCFSILCKQLQIFFSYKLLIFQGGLLQGEVLPFPFNLEDGSFMHRYFSLLKNALGFYQEFFICFDLLQPYSTHQSDINLIF